MAAAVLIDSLSSTPVGVAYIFGFLFQHTGEQLNAIKVLWLPMVVASALLSGCVSTPDATVQGATSATASQGQSAAPIPTASLSPDPGADCVEVKAAIDGWLPMPVASDIVDRVAKVTSRGLRAIRSNDWEVLEVVLVSDLPPLVEQIPALPSLAQSTLLKCDDPGLNAAWRAIRTVVAVRETTDGYISPSSQEFGVKNFLEAPWREGKWESRRVYDLGLGKMWKEALTPQFTRIKTTCEDAMDRLAKAESLWVAQGITPDPVALDSLDVGGSSTTNAVSSDLPAGVTQEIADAVFGALRQDLGTSCSNYASFGGQFVESMASAASDGGGSRQDWAVMIRQWLKENC